MSEKLVKKCELGEFNFDNDLVTNCSAVLENVEKHAEALNVSKEQTKSYLEMAQNLKPKDVSEVLKLALKIRESGEVKDTEAKNDASRLIRTIEAS